MGVETININLDLTIPSGSLELHAGDGHEPHHHSEQIIGHSADETSEANGFDGFLAQHTSRQVAQAIIRPADKTLNTVRN